MRPFKSILGWTALALLGLALAAGVTLAASQLSSQKIGLQSEPLDVGHDLAPPHTHDAIPVDQVKGATTETFESGAALTTAPESTPTPESTPSNSEPSTQTPTVSQPPAEVPATSKAPVLEPTTETAPTNTVPTTTGEDHEGRELKEKPDSDD